MDFKKKIQNGIDMEYIWNTYLNLVKRNLISRYDLMLNYHKIQKYSKRDKHGIALKKFCFKIIFGIKLENIMLLKIFMDKHLLEFRTG